MLERSERNDTFMDNVLYILAQIFAVIACALNVISMQCKKRKQILFYLIIGNIIGAIGLIFLKAYTGALIQFVFGLETFVNYRLEVSGKKNTPLLVAFYILLSIIVSIVTFKGLIDIIPLVSAILHTITIIQEKEKRIRYINLSSLVLWIPYYIAFYAWANLITCLCIVVSNVVSIFRYDIKK